MHCTFCSPEPNAFQEHNFNLLVLSSRLCQQQDQPSACENPLHSNQMSLPAPLQHSIYFGPPASHPLNGDLNFRINTFLTDPSGGWRTLQASIETLLVRCGTQLWNIYIHIGSWRCQSESKLATHAAEEAQNQPVCEGGKHSELDKSTPTLFAPLEYQSCSFLTGSVCDQEEIKFVKLDSWEAKPPRSKRGWRTGQRARPPSPGQGEGLLGSCPVISPHPLLSPPGICWWPPSSLQDTIQSEFIRVFSLPLKSHTYRPARFGVLMWTDNRSKIMISPLCSEQLFWEPAVTCA